MFSFSQDYALKNSIAELIPLESRHEDLLFEASHDIEIWQHFEENGYGQVNFKKYIQRALQQRENQAEYPFVIKDLRTDQFAGLTRIYAVNNELRNVKIGHTWIGKVFQGTGLNKTCKFLLFEFLFDALNMARIGFGASARNIRSIKAMESIGCTQEGRLRSFLPDPESGSRVDIVLLSILKEEWDTGVKRNLKQRLGSYR
ncbi:MAG: GNAT family protein [Bacteroidota bacterium]